MAGLMHGMVQSGNEKVIFIEVRLITLRKWMCTILKHLSEICKGGTNIHGNCRTLKRNALNIQNITSYSAAGTIHLSLQFRYVY